MLSAGKASIMGLLYEILSEYCQNYTVADGQEVITSLCRYDVWMAGGVGVFKRLEKGPESYASISLLKLNIL